jgi:hypothetical protein
MRLSLSVEITPPVFNPGKGTTIVSTRNDDSLDDFLRHFRFCSATARFRETVAPGGTRCSVLARSVTAGVSARSGTSVDSHASPVQSSEPLSQTPPSIFMAFPTQSLAPSPSQIGMPVAHKWTKGLPHPYLPLRPKIQRYDIWIEWHSYHESVLTRVICKSNGRPINRPHR